MITSQPVVNGGNGFETGRTHRSPRRLSPSRVVSCIHNYTPHILHMAFLSTSRMLFIVNLTVVS